MEDLVQSLRNTFNTNVTKSLKWRKQQLQALERLIDENKNEICESMKKDLNKPEQETISFEIGVIKNAITHCLNHLDEFVKPKQVTPQIQMRLSYSTYVQYQPYGIVLVLGAWNYPYQLSLVPLVGAIASGNCCLLKPSELSENSAILMEKLINKYLDTTAVKVFNGGVKETIDLLKLRFDYIFYTGNTAVGKSVMEAAAKHMTPVTLECGGKSPVYIDSSADLNIAAKRIAWGRFSNAGQTCVAPDHILCTEETQKKIIPLLKKAIEEFYGSDPKKSNSFSHIVNARHFQRIKNLIVPNKVVHGGDYDEKINYIGPTIMSNCNEDDKVMKEEIFGPVLPIVIVSSYKEAIKFINKNEKPLALYVFANNKNIYDEFLEQTTSGGYGYNEVLVHCALECLPFGGVGASGLGNYHGDFSFETFSHKRAVLVGSSFGDSLMGFRYPPYNSTKISRATAATKLSKSTCLTKMLGKSLYVLIVAISVAIIYKTNLFKF